MLLLVWAVLMLAAPHRAAAYDSPDFDFPIFSGDGIFLPEDQRASLLEALAAIASNFSTSNRIDNDLREKALAIALRIDPMHYHSRLAHRALANGELPAATTYFDSLSVVSETLWTIANRLASAPLEPEHRRLAPFLMELSLLTHPEPTDERLAAFAESASGKNLPWEKFVTLQPDDNRSTGRSSFLRQEGVVILAQQEKKENRPDRPDRPDRSDRPAADTMAGSTGIPGAADASDAPAPGRPEPIEPIIVSLNTVRQIEAIESKPVAGMVKLTMRGPAGRAERELLEQQVATGTMPVPLIASDDDIPVEGLEIPAAFAATRAWTWPAGTLGEVAFTAAVQPPGPRRLIRTRVFLPGVVLVDSILRKVPINEQMILSGELDPATMQISLPAEVLPTIEAAASGMKGKYLLVPASASEELIGYLVKSGQLEILFHNEIISYTTLDEAITFATTPTPEALSAATVIFREIEAVAERIMPLTDLARNAKVMERLETILAGTPGHLSARAMLEFGRRPESPEMRISLSANRINDLIVPLFEVDDPGVNLPELVVRMDAATVELSRMRTEVAVEVRDFHSAAEDFIKAAELYLDFTNKGTSIALQRLREARDARAKYQALGVSLGMSYPVVEVE
jgi:hypothetical protein